MLNISLDIKDLVELFTLKDRVKILEDKVMAISVQIQDLVTKVGNLQSALASETAELRAAFEDLRNRLAQIEGLDITPQLNSIDAAIAGIGALSDLAIAPDTAIPSTPGIPVVGTLTSTSLDFTWTASTDNVGVTGYEVFMNGTKTADVTTNAYSTTGLTPETNFVFSVRAKDAAGNFSVMSPDLSVTTPAL